MNEIKELRFFRISHKKRKIWKAQRKNWDMEYKDIPTANRREWRWKKRKKLIKENKEKNRV